MMVDNGIVGDSRVQKSAKSVSELGHEVLLLGRDLGNPELPQDMGNVKIVRVKVNSDATQYLKLHPRITLLSFFSYRSKLSMQRARSKIRLRKHILNLNEKRSMFVFVMKLIERVMTILFAFRRAQYALAWKKQVSRVGFVNNVRRFLFLSTNNVSQVFKITPSLFEYEEAYLPIAIEFQPDVIHAHDFRMSGAGVNLANSLSKSGKRPDVIYDAHEFLEGITGFDPATKMGCLLYEKIATQQSDRVITVSEDIAELLVTKYKLSESPFVVLNAPTSLKTSASKRNLRLDCGVGQSVPLGVYLGGLAEKRGISPVLEAMESLPELHFAFVANVNAYNTVFLDEAERRGISHRVHLLPYVSPSEIVEYVSTATFGLAPYLHDINHEVSLPSKFYEYAIAKLPIVGSDVRVVKRTIEQYGIGEVFTAGDPKTLAEAMAKVVSNHQTYVNNYSTAPVSTWTWEAQEEVLRNVYESLI